MTDDGHSPGKPEYRLDIPRSTQVVLDIVNFDALIQTEPEPGEAISIGPFARSAILDLGTMIWVAYAEGVAVECNDDSPFELKIFRHQPGFTSITPTTTVFASLDDLRDCRTGEAINLSNFVDVGGPRLEENYDLLRARFESLLR